MIDYSRLNPEQYKAVMHEEGPLIILAGAGSGKTRVLTHRIAHLIEECDVNPYRILAITFTNKAAKEMRDRVNRLVATGAEDVFISTFHSMCATFLRRDINVLGYEKSFTIYDTDDQKVLIREILKQFQIDTKQTKERVFINAISSAKNELIGPDRFDEDARGDYTLQKIAKVYREYQKRLKANNALDFDDLLMKTVEMFNTAPDVLEKYRRRFKYIMVDEYQDTNHAQFVLLKQLAEHHTENGVEHNLCVVGDDDQSIYRFRGADIRNILDFENQYPNTTVIKLEQNYRSTGTILDVANNVISNNCMRKEKSMWTENEKGDAVRLLRFSDDRDEAKGIIGDIRKKHEDGASLSDFAILYRTNAQSRLLEEQLVYNGFPYKLVGGVNFYSRMEVKDILSYLKTIENGLDSLAVRRILNVPKRGIGLTTADKVEAFALENQISFFDALCEAEKIPGINSGTAKRINMFTSIIQAIRKDVAGGMSIADLIRFICEKTEYFSYLDDYSDTDDEAFERRSNIEELINKAVTFEEELRLSGSESLPLSSFLQEISLVADIDEMNDAVPGVTLMTLHSAKGLEFPNVYICGMEEDVFPGRTYESDDNDDEEEERRLFYVGITRAMKTLTLTYAKQRMLRGQITFSDRSRFLKEIPTRLLEMDSSTSGHDYISKASRGKRLEFEDYDDSYGESSFKSRRRNSYEDNDYYSAPSSFDDYEAVSSFRKKAPQAAPSKSFGSKDPSSLPYACGDTVRHPKFGDGVVKEIVAGGKDFEVSVDFPGYGIRKLLSSFAPLKKI